jgi:parallel beta-helix repeat protein
MSNVLLQFVRVLRLPAQEEFSMYREKRRLPIYFLACFLIALLPYPAVARNYIVSSTATSTNWANAEWTNYPDSPTCTPCTPLTATANAVADDVVYFRGGTYNVTCIDSYETPAWNPTNSGTSGHPIAFMAYPGEVPSIIASKAGGATNKSDVIGSKGKHYIIWDGFKISQGDNYTGGGVTFRSTTGCILRNCEISSLRTLSGSTNSSIVYLNNSSNMLISNNKLYDCEDVANNHASAILTYSTTNCIYEKNTIYNTDVGIQLKDGANGDIIRLNFIYNVGTDGSGGYSIRVADSGTHAPQNISIYQNAIWGSTVHDLICVNMENYARSGGGDTILIYNNSFYSSGAGNAYDCEDMTNQSYFNNISNVAVYPTFYAGVMTNGAQPVYQDYNIYDTGQTFYVRYGGTNPQSYSSLANWQASGELVGDGNPDTHSYHESSQFANPGGTNPTDYKSSATHKNNGRAGSYASVIGAYITGNEQIGYVDSFGTQPAPVFPPPNQSPSPPAALRILGN